MVHRWHLDLTQYLHRHRLRGVGSVSEAARRIKDSWPEGIPSMKLDQTLFLFSKQQSFFELALYQQRCVLFV